MARYLVVHKKILILILIILLPFLWMTYQVRGGDGYSLIRLSDNLFSPPKRLISLITDGIKGFFNHYLLLVDKSKENERLIKEIDRLKTEVNNYLNLLEENKRLRSLLSLKEYQIGYVTTARVIGRDAGNWFRSILIDKGEIDGLKKDMVAVTPSGLVGRVYRVMPRTARIILITDRSSALAVRILRTRDEGILEGTGMDRCRLKYIRKSTEIKAGDVLLSSGLDGIFPEGLTIGIISRVEKEGSGFFQEVEVTPATDLSRLEEITILQR